MMRKKLDSIKRIDIFGDSIMFRVGGSSKFSTWSGTVISITIYLMIFIYGYTKYTTMIEYGDTRKQDATIQLSYEALEQIKTIEDVNFDFGFSLFK